MMSNPNCLSFWYPRLVKCGVPTPETLMLKLGGDDYAELMHILDGDVRPAFQKVVDFIKESAKTLGLPLFLRTGLGSGKHNWERTCFLVDDRKIPEHVRNLIEWSEMVDLFGLSCDVWVPRRLLPVQPLFHCARYGRMPVVPEWRVFIRDNRIQCSHPYWPTHALAQGEPTDPQWMSHLPQLHAELPDDAMRYAEAVAAEFSEYWSVDVLKATEGWYVTDMAIGERSYHWEACEYANAP